MRPQPTDLCPLCGSVRLHSLFPHYTGRCVTSQMQFMDNLTLANACCLSCGFIFNAKGTRGQTEELYTNTQWKPKPQVLAFGKEIKGQQHKAFDIFSTLHTFPEQGSLLDFGAGTGVFLEYFHAHYPQWSLFGIEPGGGNLQHSVRIPHATSWNKPYHDVVLPHKMDVIVVMSVLEHVDNPLHALQWIADNLAENGVALLQHPDFAHLPGDLLCADHVGKLTVPHTTALCAHAGLAVEKTVEGNVLFSLRCRKNPVVPLVPQVEANFAIALKAERIARATVASVQAAMDAARARGGKAAVFGTSPVGCMAPYLLKHSEKVTCFVDENPNTWDKIQDGIPIVGPMHMEALGVTELALAISPVYWQTVAEKMRAFPVQVHVPHSDSTDGE